MFAAMTEKSLTHGATDSVREPAPAAGPTRELSPAARRALAEAAVRRAQIDGKSNDCGKEVNGRGGLDPARYGDWEVKGIAHDF
jgi:hypothetical protein